MSHGDEPSGRAPPPSEPPTLGSAFPPPPEDDGVYITIVDSAGDRTRKLVPVTVFDEHFVWVEDLGVERRFNRLTGFENPPGGSWSTWRLSGHDRRRWQIESP